MTKAGRTEEEVIREDVVPDDVVAEVDVAKDDEGDDDSDDGTLQVIPWGSCEVVVDGQTVQGWGTERLCKKCTGPIYYSELYDSYFCGRCNQWHEDACSDPTCRFCSARPPHPLQRSTD